MGPRPRPSPLLPLGALVLFLLAPLVLSGWIVFLLTVAWAKALAVLGVVLLLRGGLLTFGHALYYAAGAYAAGMAVKYLHVREGLALLGLALLAGVGTSALLGLLVARYRGVYFALLNLAFSMVLYGVLLKFYAITGGTDGLGLPAPPLAGLRPVAQSLRLALYDLTLVLAALLIYAAHRFSASPVGYTLRAIRDNEVRVEYMGASVWRTIYVSYVIAGGLASVAGALIGLSVGHITPDLSFWSQSGEFVFVAILGGTGSVLAPVVGSIVFEFVRNYAFELSPYTWQMTLGIVLLVIIFFLPGGLWSLSALARRLPRRGAPPPFRTSPRDGAGAAGARTADQAREPRGGR
ncbi:MAG: branched-chain amino acid ABC transporter permease [Candidatus Rokubacteria bacterium]|nr:branched-chain amino acid ABC transporter permease [Candidatus Rokubacteria bacterium]